MVEDFGKFRKFVFWRNFEKMLENWEMMRCLLRFFDLELVELLVCKELFGVIKVNLVRKLNDIIFLLVVGNLGKFRKLDFWENFENFEFVEKLLVSCEFMRCLFRFFGVGLVELLFCKKEIVGIMEENLGKELDDIDIFLLMVEKVEKIEEEKVLRCLLRGLGLIFLVDDYGCDEMRELELESLKKKKKKEKKIVLERREEEGVCEKKSENCFFIGELVFEEEVC